MEDRHDVVCCVQYHHRYCGYQHADCHTYIHPDNGKMSLKECRNYPVTESVENFHAITDQASELFALTIIFFADICKHIIKT